MNTVNAWQTTIFNSSTTSGSSGNCFAFRKLRTVFFVVVNIVFFVFTNINIGIFRAPQNQYCAAQYNNLHFTNITRL